MRMEHFQNDDDRGKTCPSITSSTTISILNGLASSTSFQMWQASH